MGVANRQKRRLRNGASSCEGKRDPQNQTERLSASCSQMGWFSCTWEGESSCFDLFVVYIDKYKTVTINAPFKYPLRADLQREKPKGKVNLWDSFHCVVRVIHRL